MKKLTLLCILTHLIIAMTVDGARMVEQLDRGVVAIPSGNGNFISWRLQGYEPLDLGFNLYRNDVKLNASPITGATNYTDTEGNASSSYVVKAIQNGTEIDASDPVKPWSELTKRIPLSRPSGSGFSYSPNDASVGDLDGDGEYEIIFKWEPSNAQDNSKGGHTGNVLLEAIKLDGTRLWRLDLGRNIRAGAHYTQFMVADFDLDGMAETILKTAPGTKDASGNYLSKGVAAGADHSRDYRNSDGYVLNGPEWLTVFGADGRELATVDYVPGRGNVSSWGDGYGNRVDRFLAAVAYIDGIKPYAVMQRGYYSRMTLAAWEWNGTELIRKWFFDSNASGNGDAFSQGNHNLSVGDVDGDGCDEIIQGSCAIDNDGTLMYATGIGHGDAIHLSDLMPDRPGLEVMSPHEEKHTGWPGTEVHDARTGEILWRQLVDNSDVGRGIAADISAAHRGFEVWSSATKAAYNIATGTSVGGKGSVNFRIYWDGDLQDELLDGVGSAPSAMKIESWNGSTFDRLISTDGRWGNYSTYNINGTKANPCLVADILGDWREEMIMRETTDKALILFSTTTPTDYRIYTLMHDPVYRAAVAWQNVAYNQPPHLGFYIGDGVDDLPVPDIEPVGGAPRDCAGVENGGAEIDACGRCTGGETGIEPCSGFIDAADYCSAEGVVETDHAGYQGKGYLNQNNEIGSSSVFGIASQAGGMQQLFVRYANGSEENRPVSLSVNGVEMADALELPATGGWTSWKQIELTLNFTAGQNLVTFTSLTENGPPNFDGIGLGGADLAPGDCSESPSTVRSHGGTGANGNGMRLVNNRELVVTNGRQETTISVCDLGGRLLWSTVMRGKSGRYSIRNLPKGVIIVRLATPDNVYRTIRGVLR